MKKALLLAPMSSVHERFNCANISALKKLSCEIHIAANFELSDHDKEYQKVMKEDGINTHQMPFVRSSLFKNLKVIPKIKELLKSEKFDMVHCHTETGGILTRLSMSADKNAKYVFTPHGMSFYKGSSLKSQLIYYPIEKWICSKMSANFAMNSEELEVLRKWNKPTAKFIHSVGIELSKIQDIDINIEEKRNEFNLPFDAKVILSVGELNKNKNHEVILKAISKISNKENLYYIICGEGEKKECLKDLAGSIGIGERLIMPGYRRDIKEILKIADVFVFPSFHEGLAVSMMEAMAASLPVVCSKIRGNVDLIKDGEGGFLIEPTDIDGFKGAIDKILNDDNLKQAMSVKNLDNIKNFSQERVQGETEEIYRGVMI